MSSIKKVTIRPAKNGQMFLHMERVNTAPVNVYWTHTPSVMADDLKKICQTDSNTVSIKIPINNERIYYILEETDGSRFITAERTLPIEGTNNFRDMGGYAASAGKRVKWGLLYRSDHLHNITDKGLGYLKGLALRTIIDYRSINEYSQYPNRGIGEAATFHLDPSAHTAELAAQFAAKPEEENNALITNIINTMKSEDINGKGNQVLVQYRGFVTNEKAINSYGQMLRALVDKNNIPSVQHCRGGKDRTGYGVLLVLSVLGVAEKDIIEDFLITGINRQKRNMIKMEEYKKLTNDTNILDYLYSLIDTREDYILEGFKAMKEMSGSTENYIREVLNFSDEDVREMRNLYLE